jgi:hypothetical protein
MTSSGTARIFPPSAIEQIPWPEDDEGRYTRAVLGALMREGTLPFIANVEAEVNALAAGPFVLPLVTVSGAERTKNAYVCSPTTHYVDYAKQEVALELHDKAALRRLLPPVLEALRPLLRLASAERCAYVNNWLLSTNLHPDLDAATLRATRDTLLAAHPDHALVFRSLNAGLNGPLMARLEALGFQKVFSRQVYLLDPRDGAFRRRNNYGNDRRLARRTPYRWREGDALGEADAARLCALYRDLYVGKYSQYNPQFTPHYVASALRGGWLTAAALEHNGALDGVLGYVDLYGVVTAPLVGYDRSRAGDAGLYRILMLRLADAAYERGRMLHLSSGASGFKRLRGGEPFAEFSLVYHRHLAPRRRLPWRLLAWLSERAIIPLMRRYGL